MDICIIPMSIIQQTATVEPQTSSQTVIDKVQSQDDHSDWPQDTPPVWNDKQQVTRLSHITTFKSESND